MALVMIKWAPPFLEKIRGRESEADMKLNVMDPGELKLAVSTPGVL